MKKFLLSLAALAAISASASASEPLYVLDFADTETYLYDNVSSYTCNWPVQQKDTEYSWTIVDANNNNKGWGAIGIGYKSGPKTSTVTTDFAIPEAIDEVYVSCIIKKSGANCNAIKLQTSATPDFADIVFEVDGNIPSSDESNITFTIPNPASNLYYRVVFDMLKCTNSGVYHVSRIDYKGVAGSVDPDAVAAPTIGFDNLTNTVTLSCATEGAAIYYTLGGIEPTESSTPYDAPFVVTESCTVKAVAFKDGKSSPVVTKTVVVLPTARSLEELFAATPNKGDKAIVGCELTVTYANGQYVFVIDANNTASLLYASNNYHDGDVIPAGWEAEYAPYGGVPEYKGIFPAATGTAELTFASVPTVTAEDINRVVIITGVTFSDVTPAEIKKTFTGTLSDGSQLQFYTRFSDIPSVDAGTYDVKVAVSTYNGTVQAYPIEYTPVQDVVEKVVLPVFTPAGGTITEATEVAITCATDGASIYYTIDGTTPDQSSQLYASPIIVTESMTIKAIAYAADMEPSEVATAQFIYSTGGDAEVIAGSVTYDFTSDEDLAALGITKPASEGTDVTDLDLVKTPITVKISKPEGNAPKLWLTTSGATEIRCYKGNTLTVKADANTQLKSVAFTGDRVSSTYIDGLTDGVWTADENEVYTEVTFNILDKARINTIAVDYETTTGVETVAADDSNAPVQYYNLQGVRVTEPANGLYIRRQGNTVTKVIVK